MLTRQLKDKDHRLHIVLSSRSLELPPSGKQNNLTKHNYAPRVTLQYENPSRMQQSVTTLCFELLAQLHPSGLENPTQRGTVVQ